MNARRMPLVVAAVLAAICLSGRRVEAWGVEGHVIVARIAELNLSDKAKQAIAGLLPDMGFSNSTSISDTAFVSYADMVKHNSNFPQYKTSPPWHFVDIPVEPKTDYDPAIHCKDQQCALERIEQFKKVLADKTQPKKKRQEALLFLVHLVGDLAQPLHCATRGDNGGNGLKVSYLGNDGHHLNLHAVWDINLVRENLVSFDPMKTAASFNDSIKDEERQEWAKKGTKEWMMESYELARTKAYRKADGDTSLPKVGTVDLDETYVKQNRDVVALQLKKGGIRLAKVLNDALTPTAP